MRFLPLLILFASSSAYAQQTLFNVPSTQETIQGKLFGQIQMNATPEGGEVNATLELGLLQWLEVGVNVMRVPYYRVHPLTPREASAPTLQLNANVYWDPNEWLAFEVGIAGGVGFHPPSTKVEPVVSGWATARFDAPGRWGAYIVGLSTGTRGATGEGFPVAALLGLEFPLLEHYLHLQADWVIGTNALSVAVVGFVAYIGRSFQVSVGAQLPSPGTSNLFGGVLELTYVPAPGEGLGESKDRPQQRNP